jgi:hypothetical protein
MTDKTKETLEEQWNAEMQLLSERADKKLNFMNPRARPRGTDSAKVIQVIMTEALKGAGTKEDPAWIVKQYWDFEGNLLAEEQLVEKPEATYAAPVS